MIKIAPDQFALVAIHEALSALDYVPHDSSVANECDELTFALIAIRRKLTEHPFPETLRGAFVDSAKATTWWATHALEQTVDGRLPMANGILETRPKD